MHAATRNQKWRRSWQGAFTVLFLLVLWRRTCAAKDSSSRSLDSRPTIAFSGSFLLMSVYLGFAAYLQDHFQLDNVRVSAVSGGATNYFSIILKMKIAEVYELGMQMRADLLSRRLLCYLMPENWLVDRLVKQCRVLGINDGAARQVSREGRAFFGVTTFQWSPLPWPKLRVVPVAETLTDMSRQLMQSCTVPPFFARPGVLPDGKWALDGGFSTVYAIPEDADPSKTIRVTPWPFLPGDIKLHSLSLIECVAALYPLSMKQQLKLFARGYEMGQNGFEVLARKGLVPLQVPRGTLESHLRSFEEVAILRTSGKKRRSSRCLDDIHTEGLHKKAVSFGSATSIHRFKSFDYGDKIIGS